MSSTKISQLPALATLSDGTIIPVVENGATKTITGLVLKAYTVTTAVNLGGGASGNIPYQTGAGATGFVGPGTAGQILVSAGAAAPVYTNTASLYVGNAAVANILNAANTSTQQVGYAANIMAGATGSIVYQTSANATGMLSLGTSGYVLTAGASAPQYTSTASLYVGNAAVANILNAGNTSTQQVGYTVNVLGGAANRIPYQSGANATTFGAGLTYDGTTFTTGNASVTGITNATSTATGALIVSGGVGIGGSLYVGGEIVAQKLTIEYTTVTTTLVKTDDVIQTTNATAATSTTTGAVIVTGGVGIGGNLHVGGVSTANTLNLTNALGTTYGGTGLTSFTANGVVYASSSSALATGSALTFDGSTLCVSASIAAATLASSGAYSALNFTNSGGATKAGLILTNSSGILQSRAETSAWTNYDASTEYMRLTSTGLGIGTSSPGYKLQVSSTANAHVYTATGNTGTAGYGGGYKFLSYDYTNAGALDAEIAYYYGGSTIKAYMQFSTKGDSTQALTSRMIIDSSGNVGIGTSSPGAKLEVASVNSAGSYATIRLNSPFYQYWDLVNDSGFAFKRGSSEFMRLDSSGNLGIGTGSPNFKLSIGQNTALKQTDIYLQPYNVAGADNEQRISNGITSSIYSSVVLGFNNLGAGIADASYIAFRTFQGANAIIQSSGEYGVERARIDASGNLLVGYTTQQSGAKLAVNGGVFINGVVTATTFVGNMSGTASATTNLSGGSQGQIAYQSAVGTTAFISSGTTGQFLQATANGAPTWNSTGTMQVGFAKNILGNGAGNGSLLYQSTSDTTGFLGQGSAGWLLVSGGAGSAPAFTSTGSIYVNSAVNSNNIIGGATNQIHYQTGAGVTGFVTAPSAASTYLGWNGSSYVWTSSVGPQGVTGPQGPQGVAGVAGPQGPQGGVGNTGPQGPQGVAGVAGPQGPQGGVGNTGPQGPQGPAGSNGSNGATGNTGPQGPQGPAGSNGATGNTGPQGPQGPAGAASSVAGPTGPSGPSGATGSAGSAANQAFIAFGSTGGY